MTGNKSTDVTIKQLKDRIRKLEEDNRKWMHLAGMNRLTELPNNLMLYQIMLPRELSRGIEEPISLGCILICPDGLGDINQEHGRIVGDQLIKQIGDFLKQQVEPGERLFHCDGANFAILTTETSKAHARRRATLIITMIKKERFAVGDKRLRNLTCSAGIAEIEGEVEKARIPELVEHLYHELCDRLYEAKDHGGDFVVGPPREGVVGPGNGLE